MKMAMEAVAKRESLETPRGEEIGFEAAVAVAVIAGVVAERVGVVDEVEVEDDGEFVEIAEAAAAENEDNVAAAAVVDGEAAPPTLSAPNAAAAAPAVSKPRDVEDTASSPSVSPSPPYPSTSTPLVDDDDASPCPPPFP
jgi:hypothetical protein